MTNASSHLNLPIFAGQGTSAISSAQTRQTAISDASSSSGSILLAACHEAFHHALSCLAADEFSALQIHTEDFSSPQDLISPPKSCYIHNSIVSGSTIFLVQILRYLAHVETTAGSTGLSNRSDDALKNIVAQELGVLGFSSGILPACVVAASSTTFGYISKAIEAYRVALWVGIRAHLYRIETLNAASLDLDTDLPWSLVFMGIGRGDAEEAIATFTKESATALYITAVMDDTCVTISGRPDVLSDFSTFLTTKASIVIHKTGLDTLYHSSVHAKSTRNQVLHDVASQNIRFPQYSDLQVPIRSTLTGRPITKNDTSGSLVELVIDMLLIHPVNWNLVVDDIARYLPKDRCIELLNLGPGLGLSRTIERALPAGAASIVDLTSTAMQSSRQPPPKQEPIAIIGMAVNMPGAPNVSKLWEVLEQGINTISEIPGHRFHISDYKDGKASGRKMRAHTGNFISGADEFDNKFFKISPREAKSMDPQQRILLHTAYEALEDSGYVPNSTPTSRPDNFGCYIGVATHDYIQNLRDDIDVYYSPGTLKAFLSGRISYAMQLSGPSIVVDTACSSSIVALYQAARALMNKDCDAALVGGVNIITSPDMFLGLDRGHFLSPTGQCKAFDASADGYSRGEGCGAFILKRLPDALAENDRILGVIRGIEVNQSGLAHSITHPHAPTQASLFRRLLGNSNIDANRVNVIEAHGTGTQAGDPNELESIRSVFCSHRSSDNPLHITSIKANIGHLEAASGAAGLAKLLLMMERRSIPRQISLTTLNPRIAPLHTDHTVIDTVPDQWSPASPGATRVAMLNNFGAAGSNSAVLVEEYLRPQIAPSPPGMYLVFGLSAKDSSALEILRSKYLRFLENCGADTLADVAYSMTARRQIYDHRISVFANSKEALVRKLQRALPAQVNAKNGSTVFVFSGQGGQYVGMGRSLYHTSVLFRSHIDECHEILKRDGFPGVLDILTAETQTSGLSELEEFEAYQASIFALQYALAKLWISWGISPAAVVGHSLGEYAALVISGVLSLEDALCVVAHRVRLMVQRCAVNKTGMIAVNLGAIALQDILRASPEFSSLSIACHNSPSDSVLSGPLETLKSFKEHLDDNVHCKNILLSVPFGYHSHAMAPLLNDLKAIARRVSLRPPTIPIVSNAFGEVIRPGDSSVINSDYFARHCAEPVQFEKGIQALMRTFPAAQFDVWIEIGPHSTTLPMLKANPSLPRGSTFLPSLRKQHDSWETLTGSLSQLFLEGVPIQWREVFAHLPHIGCVSLPSYPFSPSKFWVEYKEPRATSELASNLISATPSTGFAMLGRWTQRPSAGNNNTAIFETPIEKVAGWIRGHSVGGFPLCPASVYTEQALSAIHLTCADLNVSLESSHILLRKLQFPKPLVYDPTVSHTLFAKITIEGKSGAFVITSRVGPSAHETIHARGEFRIQLLAPTFTKFARYLPTVARHMKTVSSSRNPEAFSRRTAYEVIFPRVVEYSKEYHSIRSITVDSSSMEGIADVCLPEDHSRDKFIVHPVFSDTLLHVAGFIANLQGSANDAYICTEVESVKLIPDIIDNSASYSVYCSNGWVPEDDMVLADAYAVSSTEPKRIIAHIKGMQFRRVRLDKFKRGLSLASKHYTAQPAQAPTLAPPKVSYRNTSVEDTIVALVSETCGLSVELLDLDADLASLGVDSLMSIELYSRLEQLFSEARLNSRTLSFCTTVADIIREVSTRAKTNDSRGCDSPATAISGTSTPRTLVPDDPLSDSNSDEEFDLKKVLAPVLGLAVHEIKDDVDFDSLGLDSLTSIEALHLLKSTFGLELSSDIFTTFCTPRTLQAYLTSHLFNASKSTVDAEPSRPALSRNMDPFINILRLDTNPIVVQSTSSGRSPLFLIHDGSGLVNYYERLSPLQRSVWAIHNPNFLTSRSWESLSAMARTYANYIADLTVGPVLLGGWSFGGVAAYEVARHLELLGRTTQGILLIDAPNPIGHVPLSEALIDSVLKLDDRSTASEMGKLVKAQFSMNARLLGDYEPQPFLRDCPPLVMLRSVEAYKPLHIQVPAWLSDRSRPDTATEGWATLSRTRVEILDIPGHHFEPFHHSNVAVVSARISEGCDILEQL